jgi:hypothetical protein
LQEAWPTVNKTLTAEQLEAQLESYVTYGLEEVLDIQSYLADFGYKLICGLCLPRIKTLKNCMRKGLGGLIKAAEL